MTGNRVAENEDTLVRLVRMGKRLGTAFDRSLEEETISLTQWELIYCLWKEGPMRQKLLAARIGVDPGAVVKLVDRLHRDGWVRRQLDRDDQRANFVHLSDSAKKKCSHIFRRVEAASAKLSKGIPKSEIAALASCLDKLSGNLEEVES